MHFAKVMSCVLAAAALGWGCVTKGQFEEYQETQARKHGELQAEMAGLAPKAELDELARDMRRLDQEVATQSESFGKMEAYIEQVQEDLAVIAREQARQRDRMVNVLEDIEALRDMPELLDRLDAVMAQTASTFVRSLQIQGAAAQEQADKLAELAAEIEKSLRPPEQED